MQIKWWVRAASAVAIVAAFCIAITEVIKIFPELDRQRIPLAIGFGAFGALGLGLGAVKRRQRAEQRDEFPAKPGHDNDSEVEEPFFLFTPDYLGMLLLAFAAAVYFLPPIISPIIPDAPAPVVDAQKPEVKRVETPPITNAPPRPFPVVKLKGIFYRQGRPSAILDRGTFYVGDTIAGAQVVSIERTSVTLEVDGQQKKLRLW